MYVGKYEVTQGEWERVMGATPSHFRHAGPEAPVEQVSWEDCQEFVGKLCEVEGVEAGTYRLLTEAEGIYEGDFYSYRYFAAEGFLPGYNFPRLPISAYVPGRRRHKGRDEFVSRPRFLAISEFGPRALIYHEGGRYRVYKVNLDFGSEDVEATHSLVTATMKRCTACGYAHIENGGNMAEVCDRCGTVDPFRQSHGIRRYSERAGVASARCYRCGHKARIVKSY